MINRVQTCFIFAVLALVVAPICMAQVPVQLPDPDGKPVDATKPVKVYILMGQSNMVGFGRVDGKDTKGSLEYYTQTKDKFPHLIDNESKWTVRNDVWCVKTTVGQKQGWLQPGFGARKHFFRPRATIRARDGLRS